MSSHSNDIGPVRLLAKEVLMMMGSSLSAKRTNAIRQNSVDWPLLKLPALYIYLSIYLYIKAWTAAAAKATP